MRKILTDLLLLVITIAAIWWVLQYRSCSQKKGGIYTSVSADTVYIKGEADTIVTVKKYNHTIRKKKSTEPVVTDTVVTESYTAVVSIIEGIDSIQVDFAIVAKEREVFRVDTVVVTERRCSEELWLLGAVTVLVVLWAVLQ